MSLVSVGYGNMVSSKKLVAVVAPDAAPIKRLVQQAKETDRVVDATCGKRTKSVLFFESGHIVLSALMPETIAQRFEEIDKND